MRRLLAALALAAVALAPTAGADKGGPSPGVVLGWKGVPSGDASVRYVALAAGRSTTVAAVRMRDGLVLRYGTVRGAFGVPLVAYDGSTAGLAHDGRTLVLGPIAADRVSRFAVLATRTLRPRATVALPGTWSFDALSPDGRMLYLVEYLSVAESPGYRVRAYDLERNRLLPRPVLDPTAGSGPMTGEPVTRVNGPGGGWAYTLYRNPGGFPFVHALDTRRAKAMCIELPWRDGQDALWSVRMSMAPDGTTLVLRQRGERLAAIDTQAFRVRAFARPRA